MMSVLGRRADKIYKARRGLAKAGKSAARYGGLSRCQSVKRRGGACVLGAALLALGAAAPAAAQDGSGHVALSRVLDVASGDWNEDGFRDRAALVLNDAGDGDFYLFLSDGEDVERAAGSPTLVRRGLVWSGALFGTLPSLRLTEAGGFQIIDENSAVGRNRWKRTLTIAWRGEALRVAGYSYEAYDTLDPAYAFTCDVNLLTARGVRDGARFLTDAAPLPLADWTDAAAPEECAES